ncbi:ABC transporter substrate-binding protein [Taklimakanibacter deserti]|uniref:ABC transporter substrate-binding protein n=1 Tax=Taklimakanibacter deserti TaxID=2267839 RepID=UPI000E6558DC
MRMLKRALLGSLGLMALGGLAHAEGSVTVVSWGGLYTEVQNHSFYQPFSKTTGIAVKSEDWNGNLGQIRAQVDAKNVTWDVVIGDSAFAKKGCEEGFLEKIDPAVTQENAADFLPGSITDCGVASVVWGYVIGYDERKVKDRPGSVADFFDLQKYPGKRALPKRPESTLEFALMADGVPAKDVYSVLATPEGVDRAFKKLDTIKSEVVWWEAGAQPPQLLNDGEVTMAVSFAARLVGPILDDKKPFGILYDGMLYDLDTWMIPKGSPHKKEAEEFIKFASDPGRQAELATRAGYAPVRISAIGLVGKHPTAGVDMKQFMLTNPDNQGNAAAIDAQFWSDNLDDLKERFNAWLAQ